MLVRTWLRIPAPVADATIALFFVVVSQIELHHRVDDGYQAGPLALNMPLALLMVAPLALRRRAPVVTVLVMTAAACVPSVLVAHTIFFWGSMVPLAIAVFTVARHRDGAAARYAWVVGPLLLATSALHVAEVRDLSDVCFASGLFGAVWGAGRLLRHYADQRAALSDALEQLAAGQAQREEAAVQAERRRIASEMHDVVAHAVSLMTVQVGAARMELASVGTTVPVQLRAAEEAGRQALAELRRTLGVMRSSGDRAGLQPVPDLGTIDDLATSFEKAGLHIDLDVQRDGALPASLQLAAYRIVQESLTNVVKHAGQVGVCVSVRSVGDDLVVTVTNAAGRRSEPLPGGHGLTGMRERVAMFGGQLEATRQTGGGFRVLATMPLPQASDVLATGPQIVLT